jgi:hypothetical protein
MRLASRWCGLLTAIVVVVLISSCENPSRPENSPALSAPTATQRARRAEFRQYLVNLASDAARWKSNLQEINSRNICADRGAAAAIDESVAAITKSLDVLQARIQTLAQQETLDGDIELLTGLQAISSDTTRLESLLPCALSRVTPPAGPAASGVVAAWSEQVRKMRQQAADHATRLQAQSLALARNARLPSDEEGKRWSSKDFVELVKALAWPLAVGLALLIFRRPLSRFFEQIAGKITKVSVFDVAIELATVPSGPTPWLDPGVYAGTELFGGDVTTTTIMDLFARIRDDTAWNYLIVDLKNGRHWLESRLYLFTTILQQMGGLRCVIFVRSSQNRYRRFLGIAAPEDVRRALAGKYAWLRTVLDKSVLAALAATTLDPSLATDLQSLLDQLKKKFCEPLPNNLDDFFSRIAGSLQACQASLKPMRKDLAETISEKFIFDSLMRKGLDPLNPEWSKLGPFGPWDHSQWLTMARFNEDLRGLLVDTELSQLEDTPDAPADERTRALLRRPVPFVAIVNRNGEFQRLVDRKVLIEQVTSKFGEHAAEFTFATAAKRE